MQHLFIAVTIVKAHCDQYFYIMQSMFKIKWKLYYIMMRTFDPSAYGRELQFVYITRARKKERKIKRKHLYKKKNSDVSLELLYIAFEIQ